jgi:uncharacterized membrane protein YfcA
MTRIVPPADDADPSTTPILAYDRRGHDPAERTVSPAGFAAAACGISAVGGAIGALLGLGGGVIVVPALLLLGVDIRLAVGAAAVSVIATSSGAASSYLRRGYTNLRVAMFLEVGTVAGAFCGALAAGFVDERVLCLVFAGVLSLSAVALLRKPTTLAPPDPAAAPGVLDGVFVDAAGGALAYRARRAPLALALMVLAGVASGMLGIGSGALKVLAMDLVMGLPVKVSSATSNLMIGVTAASTAAVCLLRGDVNPFVVAPVVAGIVVGSRVGARLLRVLPPRIVRAIFVVVVVVIAGQMFWRGIS